MNCFIYISGHFTPHGRHELNKLTSLPMCGFIAQLVEHRTSIAEVTGSNPVEALSFFRLLSNCLKLRWSFFTFIYIRSSNMNCFIYISRQKFFFALLVVQANALISGYPGGLTPGTYGGIARDLLTFVANFWPDTGSLDRFCTSEARYTGKGPRDL